ncbi:hypothetical protein N7495_001437 [Penicillium taxi]|uniref:uncharacterized protein n=1 Tax=Penicillium taxi TaxID=168475 RepID=UPI002544E949|nr:uncharacterized protein N7495_001437 [Penicillium taxi]KAJ5908755.1 hypothetical protein N7495_001437 [Penicillium taxi]
MASTHPQDRSMRKIVKWGLFGLALSALYYLLHDILFVSIGIGRKIQTIEEFPWTCTRLQHPLLEGCEDMWLDHHGRKLYAACTSIESRQGWSPGGNLFNISARSRTDHISVIDIDRPMSDGLYGLRTLKLDGFPRDIDLHGFDVHRTGDRLRFWLINHQPAVNDATGEFLDPKTAGANSTIEIFDLDNSSEVLQYVKTIASDSIVSPNNVAVDSDGVGAVITNDHNSKVGTFHCNFAAKNGFAFPNGIIRGQNGMFYVANSISGVVGIYRLKNGQLNQVDTVSLGYPLDNISVDSQGSVIAAAIADSVQFVKSMGNPYNVVAPAAVFSIHETSDGKHEFRKMVEDKAAKALPSSTIAVHDVQSHLLFLAGIFSPFITRCEKYD